MNVHATGDLKFTGLTRPDGAPLRLNDQEFVAIDRDRNAKFEATYRPQALYNRANEGFHANNETFLLHEVATNLPIYLPDTGPTDFHLHLPPGGFQLVLVTSGAFTFDYDGRFYNVGPGAVMLQSAIVHRQLFYTWSGLSTEENLKTPQTVVPDPISMGYSGKFLEAFITDPTTFPNPTIVGPTRSTKPRRRGWHGATLCMIARSMQASGSRTPWRWMRCSSRSPTARSNRPCRFTCAISGSRLRAVTSSPATSSQPIRAANRSCPRARRQRRTPHVSPRARS